VLSQAGDSVAGRRFAARFAELVYTRHDTIPAAVAYYQDIKNQAAGFGRAPDGVKVLSGKDLVIADDRAAASAKVDALNGLLSWDDALLKVWRFTSVDLRGLTPADPIPDLPAVTQVNNGQGAMKAIRKLIDEGSLKTVGQLAEAITKQTGSAILAGTPADIADILEEWFTAGAADGFVIDSTLFPDSGHRFVRDVVPILRERGLFRDDYEASTLREDLVLTALSALRQTIS
jgi:alkanesulfonate monooxygenase SsuD/methylene tetrahydromethanopterin reductase-like flavin-dependent oxidoreductase (luciferase family)